MLWKNFFIAEYFGLTVYIFVDLGQKYWRLLSAEIFPETIVSRAYTLSVACFEPRLNQQVNHLTHTIILKALQ